MNVGIIDADLLGRKKHRFPNLAAMKISAFRKSKGDDVALITSYDDLDGYDHIYLSKVFTDTFVPAPIMELSNLDYGGTGFFYDKAPPLPTEIEHMHPDYHLYDEWVSNQISHGSKKNDLKYYTDYSIGFLTRGCFRRCPFCVNKNYRVVSVNSPLYEFVDPERPKICLLDDNFLGCSEWKRLLAELQDVNKPFQFKQGLDERLLTDDKCEMIFSSKYDGDYIFAFDNVADSKIIETKLQLIRKYSQAVLKFYVFCGYDRKDKWDKTFWQQDVIDLWMRIELLMKYKYIPYIMRYNRYTDSPYAGLYITMARWCNQPAFFKKMNFREFVIADQRGGSRASLRYMENAELAMPELTKFFDIKY